MPNRPLATKDNASGQLNAGISAGTTTIPLKAGEGANFPTTYGGSATSLGSERLLNSTGIQAAGVVAGMIIENTTDGSYAVVLSVSTDAVVTTRLRGGSDNTWQSSDVWAVNRFVITMVHYDTDGETVLKREKVLIKTRATDTLTAETGGRGYDSSTAQSFDADDYAYVLNSQVITEGLKQTINDVMADVDKAVKQSGAEIFAASATGNDSYAITLAPVPAALTDGMIVTFKTDVGNTGPATLNVNGLGAKTIKKLQDQDLVTGDIEAGQRVMVGYDLANDVWEMVSQVAAAGVTTTDVLNQATNYIADTGAADAYVATLSPAAASYTTGMRVSIKAANANTGPATINVNGLGAKNIFKNGVAVVAGDIVAGQMLDLEYDGTQFQVTSFAPPVLPRFNFSTIFETVTGRFTGTAVGTGAAAVSAGTSAQGGGAQLSTGTTNPSSFDLTLGLGRSSGALKLFAGKPVFSAIISSARVAGTTAGSGLVIGVGAVTVAGTGFTLTPAHFGFKIIYSSGWKLFATQADGSTEAASASLATIADQDIIELFAIHRGTQIDYYNRINGGALSAVTTLNTNLPPDATTAQELQAAVSNASSASNIRMGIACMSYERDAI